MSNIEFRSDVSMQDVDVPELVLFLLVPKSPKPSIVVVDLPVPAPFLEQTPYASNGIAGNQIPTIAWKITCGQDAPLDRPVPLLSIGADPNQCGLVLDRRHADPVHCQIYAQLNSGFDVWIIEDDSTTGTFYRRLRDEKDRENIDDTEELHTEELVHKDGRAVQGLRYLRIGLYEFHCRLPKDKREIAERERWFRRHEPLPITSELLVTQLAGRRLDIQEKKNIGKGGFGEVFMSMEMHTGLLVAVKKQKVGNDPRGVRNIHREIRSMKDLHHRNVVKIIHSYETSPEDELRVFHLVMPLYSCSLRNALPVMKHESKRNAMIQMVEGLKYIHGNGFLHRDIKPENVFISERTPTNIVLGDLGLLSPIEAIGRMAGTNIYKAPEVYFDLRQTTSIDIYALGITFLEMLDGRAIKGGWRGLKQWVEDLWDHPPPSPFSNLIIEMTAPYPHTLRPGLDSIQRSLLQHKDLRESVERPLLNLKETMDMLKEEHELSTRPTPRVPMSFLNPRPAPLPPQFKPVKSRLDPQLLRIEARYISENHSSKTAGPLDLVHTARGLAPQANPLAEATKLKSPDPVRDTSNSVLSLVQDQSSDFSSTQNGDVTHVSFEPGDTLNTGKIELLETQFKARERALEKRTQKLEITLRQIAEGVRARRQERGSCGKASGPRRERCPGEWPSRPMFSGAGSFSRVSRFANDASQDSILTSASSDLHLDEVGHRSRKSSLSQRTIRSNRPTRARINTHARPKSDRISKRTNVCNQTNMIQGLTLALKAGAGSLVSTLTISVRSMFGL